MDAFAAYKSDESAVTVGNKVPYDIVLTNLHNGYNNVTGIATKM